MSFHLFKKLPADQKLRAIVSGTVIPIEEVPDPVFSGKVLGDGIAFLPAMGCVTAPASGTITAAMPHAVGLTLDIGLDILIHIGIDTIEMQGEGFQLLTSEGQKVKTGQPLVKFDRDAIASAGHSDTIMMIFTDESQTSDLKMFSGMEAVAKETVVAEIA